MYKFFLVSADLNAGLKDLHKSKFLYRFGREVFKYLDRNMDRSFYKAGYLRRKEQ